MDFKLKYFLVLAIFLCSCSTVSTTGTFDKQVKYYKNVNGENLAKKLAITQCEAVKLANCIKIDKAVFYIPTHCEAMFGEYYDEDWSFNGVVNSVVWYLPSLHGSKPKLIIQSSTDKTVNLFIHWYFEKSNIKGIIDGVELYVDEDFITRQSDKTVQNPENYYSLSYDFRHKVKPLARVLGRCD